MDRIPYELKCLILESLDSASLINLYLASPRLFPELESYWILSNEFDYKNDGMYPRLDLQDIPLSDMDDGRRFRFNSAIKGVLNRANSITASN